MSERHRELPPWMVNKKEKETETETEPLRSRRKRKTARAAFYCMNEKELVEAAVSYLTNGACEDAALPTDQTVEDKAVDTMVKMRENPSSSKPATEALEEESSDCGDAQGTTCVSETDLDITEVETLPYTKSPQHQGPEDQRPGPAREHDVGREVEKKEVRSQTPADAVGDDDSLRLVREIFFT